MIRFLSQLIGKKANSDYDKILIEKLGRIKDEPIFWNNESNVYAKFNDLNNYQYLSLKITGFLNIHTTEGCVLIFTSESGEYRMKSESEIVEGDYSQISKIGLTEFDIDIDSKVIEFFEKNEVKSVKLITKNNQPMMSELEFKFDNIDLTRLLNVLKNQV